MAELAFRIQMRGMAPGNNQSLAQAPLLRSRRVSNATCAPCCARRVKRRVRRYGCFQLVRQQCRQLCMLLLSSSRWRRRSRPGSHQKRAISQLLSLPVAKRATAAASERAHDQMRAVLPFRAGHSRMHIADCVTAPPYHHRCRNRLTGRGAAASGV